MVKVKGCQTKKHYNFVRGGGGIYGMALRESLEAATTQLLLDSKIQDPEVINLRIIKVRSNLSKALATYPEDELLGIQDKLLSAEFNASTRLNEPAKSGLATKNETAEIGTDEQPPLTDELNLLTSDLRLRRRSVNKLEVNSYQQDQLSSELVDMAQTIKRNAELFQQKLDTDSDLLSTTSDAITRTAGSMSNVGQKLSRYRRETQTGWMFYIWSTLFIILSLFFGMALIQLFGKW